MEKICFYRITPEVLEYTEYLRQVETKARGFSRIPDFKLKPNGKKKFVCGPVIISEDGRLAYVAPITSHIEKNENSILIEDRGRPLSSIRFNYMFPVPTRLLERIDFNDISDRPYRDLVQKEYFFLKKNRAKVFQMASLTYDEVMKGYRKGLIKNSCAFALLEHAAEKYL